MNPPGRTLEETAVLFDGDSSDPYQPPDNAPDRRTSLSAGTLAEVEDRARYLASMEKSPRKLTMAEFCELERAKTPNSPSTSEYVGSLGSPRTTEIHLEAHRDLEAYPRSDRSFWVDTP